MALTATIALALGSSQTGLTLSAQLKDTAGVNSGSAVTTGFVELGVGNYSWTYASFGDTFRGTVVFSASAVVKAVVAINPEDLSAGAGDTGSGDTAVDHNTGSADAMRVTVNGAGADAVRVIAYVAEDYAADPSGTAPEAETITKADGRWTDALNLDEGVEYTIRFTKSGYTFPNATVTP